MGTGYYELPGTATNHASAPDIAAYNPTTSVRIDVRAAADDWSRASDEQALMAQWVGLGLDWLLRLETSGALRFFYDNSSRATSSSAVSISDGSPGWVRCDCTFGAGTAVVTFYESTTDTLDPDSASYSQISTHTGLTIATSSHQDELQIGAQAGVSDPFDGKLYRARYQVDGTTQFDADFTDLTADECSAGSFVEDSANAATVTLTGGTCVTTSTGEPGVDMLLLGVPL